MGKECGQFGRTTDSKDTNISDYNHKDSNFSKTTVISETGCSRGYQIRSASSHHSDLSISCLIRRTQQNLGKLRVSTLLSSVAMNMNTPNMHNSLQDTYLFFIFSCISRTRKILLQIFGLYSLIFRKIK